MYTINKQKHKYIPKKIVYHSLLKHEAGLPIAIYVDNICLLAPNALGFKKLLEICYGFSQDNDTIFSSLKSAHVVFRHKSHKLFCPPVYMHIGRLSPPPPPPKKKMVKV